MWPASAQPPAPDRTPHAVWPPKRPSCGAPDRCRRAKPESGELEYYIDDILLGPITNRYKPLFAPGTSVEFCIKKGKELHLGLTAQALKPDSETCSIPDGVELLKKNIVSNFTNIKKIHIYIGGRPAGE